MNDARGVERVAVIPFRLLNRSKGLVKLVFDLPDTKSPRALNMNVNARDLAIGLKSIKVKRFEGTPSPRDAKTERN